MDAVSSSYFYIINVAGFLNNKLKNPSLDVYIQYYIIPLILTRTYLTTLHKLEPSFSL